MIGVALKGLLGRKLRAALTAFAIVLGVSMISGSFVLTDTLGKTFDGIYEESYADTDAVISAKDATSTADDTADAPSFDAAVLREVEALPGVDLAQGSIEDEARLVDEAGEPIGGADDGIAFAVEAEGDQSLNPLQLVGGSWPSGDRQIAIDKSTAEKHEFEVGQTVSAFGDGPVRKYELTGIVRFGTVDSLGSATITVFDLPTAQALFDKRGKLDLIRVSADEGVTTPELLGQIRPLLSETTQVKSAVEQASADCERHPAGAGLHQVLPARLRRNRVVRRQLRDREHARDHRRTASAGARDPADARCVAAAGAVVGRARVRRRRLHRLGRSGSSSVSGSPLASRRSSTRSGSPSRAEESSSRPGRSSSASPSGR